MIDLIIPITSKCPNLKQTLLSIMLQSIKDKLNIVLVTNKLNKHKSIIDLFLPKLNISILESKDKKTIEKLKEYALSNTTNEYIMFLDENTYLYDAFSLSTLYNQLLNDNSDFIIGNTVNLIDNNYYNTFSIYDNSNNKIYKRSYLNKNNIIFTNESLFTATTYLYNRLYSYSDSITSVNINTIELIDKKVIKNIISSIKELSTNIDKNFIKEYINNIIRNTNDKYLNSNIKYNGILKDLEKLYDEYN